MKILDVGCGYLSDHKRREGIGIDLQRGTCDIVADAHYLPFRPESLEKVFARNVLEHVNNPIKVLYELKRVTKKEAKISITIPIRHNPCVDESVKLLLGFPFRLLETLKRLKRWKQHRKESGFWHKNRIRISDISKFFLIAKIARIYPTHPLTWFLWKIRIVKRDKRIYYQLPDVYYIYAVK